MESIKAHDRSESHIKCCGREKAKNAKPGTTKADQMLLQLNSAVTEQITNMMLTVHAIAKSG